MIAKLHFIDGEIVELNRSLSLDLRRILSNRNLQSIHPMTLSDGSITYCMWSVKKIEWIK